MMDKPPSLRLAVLSRPLPPDWLSPLDGQCELLVGDGDLTALLNRAGSRLDQAAGLFSLLTDRVDDSLLARLPALRVVSNMAVGVDNVDVAACSRRGIPVGHTPGVLTDSTADLALALLLSAARRLPEAAADARAGRWTTWTPDGWLGQDLRGRVLGIVGLGKIGRAVAERARVFGLDLLYANRTRQPEAEQALDVRWVTIDELLAASDFVSLHVPLTQETRGLITLKRLRLMKPTALLINTARGPVVETQALVAALEAGWIGGAALDVTDPEPLPADHPLYRFSNCLIAPHIGSATHGTRRRMAELACLNLLAGLAGRPLPHCVNPKAG